jgi:hypothetical protein
MAAGADAEIGVTGEGGFEEEAKIASGCWYLR